MTIYDISLTITPDMVTWENAEPALALEWQALIDDDTPANVSRLVGGSHTGTHLDAPLHFVAGGGCVPDLDLNVLMGPARVVWILGSSVITAATLEAAGIPDGTERLVLSTDNTTRRLLRDPLFHKDYVGLAPSGAQWLLDHGIRLIGIDYLSVGSYGAANVETHRILLGGGVVIVEGLALEAVLPGEYMLAALPLKIEGAEGSPCRAVLWQI